ncbi:peptidylprolyl isomerase [Parvularcula sp. IMCC14364]|uniref:peptidylprolyl isomerase n=1 Tax=Parvularcula sp. IMCC14364 TaxID=3067902 RepID=UPI0027426CD1|nr:peptidylprolyl isomerase [Parvularcula sp. IMCC14364]
MPDHTAHVATRGQLAARLKGFAGDIASVCGWFGKLLWRSLLLATQDIAIGMRVFRRWLNSTDGQVALSVLTLSLVIVGMKTIDALRLYEPPVQMQAEQVEAPVVAPEPDPVLVRIGRRQLRHSDVLEYAHQAGKLPEAESLSVAEVFERGLVTEAIDQFLLARAGQANEAVTSDPEVTSKLAMARNRILSAAHLQEVIADKATEERAVRLYQSQRENISFGDELRLRHVVVAEEVLARGLRDTLQEGSDFAQIARDFSIDPVSAGRDGQMGYLAFGQMPGGYAERAYAMANGEISEVFETEGGWAFFKVEGRRPVRPPSFDSVREDILEFLRLQAIEQELDRLRNAADVTVYQPGEAVSSGSGTDSVQFRD